VISLNVYDSVRQRLIAHNSDRKQLEAEHCYDDLSVSNVNPSYNWSGITKSTVL